MRQVYRISNHLHSDVLVALWRYELEVWVDPLIYLIGRIGVGSREALLCSTSHGVPFTHPLISYEKQRGGQGPTYNFSEETYAFSLISHIAQQGGSPTAQGPVSYPQGSAA